MKCEGCDSRATIHIIDISINGVRDFHLCAKCAKRAGYDLMPDNISFEDVLQRLLNDSSELIEKGRLEDASDRHRNCPVCGLSKSEILEETCFGCEEDFNSFRDEIREMIKMFHGEAKHIGKSSIVNSDLLMKKKALQILQKRLEEAVKAENFELAAQFRDEIKALQ